MLNHNWLYATIAEERLVGIEQLLVELSETFSKNGDDETSQLLIKHLVKFGGLKSVPPALKSYSFHQKVEERQAIKGLKQSVIDFKKNEAMVSLRKFQSEGLTIQEIASAMLGEGEPDLRKPELLFLLQVATRVFGDAVKQAETDVRNAEKGENLLQLIAHGKQITEMTQAGS